MSRAWAPWASDLVSNRIAGLALALGEPAPDARGMIGSVVLLSAGDGPDDTIKPRLEAAIAGA